MSFSTAAHGFVDVMSKGLDYLWVEMLTRGRSALFQCLCEAQRFVIRALGGHCVEGVCCSYDPSAQGNIFTLESIRVSCAIIMLMVVTNQRKSKKQIPDRFDDTLTGQNMSFDRVIFHGCERIRLAYDEVSHANLSDIMEFGRSLDFLALLFAQSHRLGDPYRVTASPSRMAPGIRIFGTHGVH